jgi:Fe-S-cluster containining protein
MAERADAFFARVADQHGSAMRCRLGCTHCCQQELTVLPLEALAVVAALEALPGTERAAVAQRANRPGPPCAWLDGERCAIYASRPLICRTHGLPVRYDRPGAGAAVPTEGAHARADAELEIALCELNFTDGIPPDAILDGGVLLAALTVADALARRQLRWSPAAGRIGLRDLARVGRDALPHPSEDC